MCRGDEVFLLSFECINTLSWYLRVFRKYTSTLGINRATSRGVSHKLFIDSNVMAAPINRLVLLSPSPTPAPFPPPPPRAIPCRMPEHYSRSPKIHRMYLGSAVTHSRPSRSGCPSLRKLHVVFFVLSSQHILHLPHH